MTKSEEIIKEMEMTLTGAVQKLQTDLSQIRGNRPSTELLQDIRLNLYGQSLTIRELGSISILPPRTIQITVWDPGAVGAVMHAIDGAHLGLSTSNDGNNIRATLSALGDERREELMKLVKKTAEAARIQVRSRRDEAMKRLKEAQNNGEITEDDIFKGKEKTQKVIDAINKNIEVAVEKKLTELGE